MQNTVDFVRVPPEFSTIIEYNWKQYFEISVEGDNDGEIPRNDEGAKNSFSITAGNTTIIQQTSNAV